MLLMCPLLLDVLLPQLHSFAGMPLTHNCLVHLQ